MLSKVEFVLVLVVPALPGFSIDSDKSPTFLPTASFSQALGFCFQSCPGLTLGNVSEDVPVEFWSVILPQNFKFASRSTCVPLQVTSTISATAYILDIVKCTTKCAVKWSFLMDFCLCSVFLLCPFSLSCLCLCIICIKNPWSRVGRKRQEYFSWGMNISISSSHSWTHSWEQTTMSSSPTASLERHGCHSWHWTSFLRYLILSVDTHWFGYLS